MRQGQKLITFAFFFQDQTPTRLIKLTIYSMPVLFFFSVYANYTYYIIATCILYLHAYFIHHMDSSLAGETGSSFTQA